jgi:hypothetical protein
MATVKERRGISCTTLMKKRGVDSVLRSFPEVPAEGERRRFTAEHAAGCVALRRAKESAEQNAEDPGFVDESRIECIQPEPGRWRIEERFGTNLSSSAKISASSAVNSASGAYNRVYTQKKFAHTCPASYINLEPSVHTSRLPT